MTQKLKINETTLLVIDINNACCHQKCENEEKGITFTKIRKMVPAFEKFVSRYRETGGQVIYVNCVPWKEKFLAKNLVELYQDPKAEYYSTDETGFSEEFYQLEPAEEDLVISKNSYDAFTNPELDKFLKKKNIKHLAMAGVFGDGCVQATITGAFSAGYNLIILKDLIETTDLPIRQGLQKLLKEYTWPVMYGKTIDAEEFFETVK